MKGKGKHGNSVSESIFVKWLRFKAGLLWLPKVWKWTFLEEPHRLHRRTYKCQFENTPNPLQKSLFNESFCHSLTRMFLFSR